MDIWNVVHLIQLFEDLRWISNYGLSCIKRWTYKVRELEIQEAALVRWSGKNLRKEEALRGKHEDVGEVLKFERRPARGGGRSLAENNFTAARAWAIITQQQRGFQIIIPFIGG